MSDMEFASDVVALSILVPVKDEEESVGRLVDEVVAALDGSDVAVGRHWELIFIDDGSTDRTWEEIRKASGRESRVRALRFRRNFGKSTALAAGLAAARGRLIATLDGDLQDDPAEIPGMIARLDEADLVAGFKADRKDPISKRLPSKIFNAVTSLVTGLKLRDHNCGLKVARREVFEAVPLYGEMHRYFAAIAHAQGFKVVEQSVNHRPRLFGRSKFGLERYARGGLDLITVLGLTRYTNRPAHLFGGVGLVMGVLGMAILAYLGAIWLFTDQGIGTRPLLTLGVLMVLVGVQLISLGVLAEMMVRREVVREDPLSRVVEMIDLD